MPRTIRLNTFLPAPIETVRVLLMQPATLVHVSAPLLRFHPLGAPFPQRWTEGTWRVRLEGPAGLPLGWQEIRISFPQPPSGGLAIRDDGRGRLVSRWDHLIEIAPEKAGTRYTYTIAIEAGWRTPFVAVFARVFYAHRQRRWRKLVQTGVSRTGVSGPCA